MEKHSSAGLVLFRKEKIKTFYLILHYESGHWDFPKGGIEEGESLKETAARECEEETGIKDINFIDGFKERITYMFKTKGSLVSKEVFYLLGETKTKEVKLSYEHIGYEWVEYDKAYEKVTFKNSKDVLKKANDFLHSSLYSFVK